MRFTLLVIVAITMLFACHNSTRQNAINRTIYLEIKNRLEILHKLSVQNDTLSKEVGALRDKFRRLLLLSKDIENISACVNLSDFFFEEMAETYGIDINEFRALDERMNSSEIETVLIMNELSILNFLVNKYQGKEIILFSATEQVDG